MERGARTANEIAGDWAQPQPQPQTPAEPRQPAAPPAAGGESLVYRNAWPSNETYERLAGLESGPAAALNDRLDSTLDLRDGLSVVEVFVEQVPEEAPFELEFFRGF